MKSTNFPSIKGRIPFEGLIETKFWLRVFNLEEAVVFAQAKVNEKPERKRASVPIVNDFIVSEQLHFYFIIHLLIDPLGLQDGMGIILYSDQAHAKEVMTDRNELADQLMQAISKHARHQEEFEIEFHSISPQKET